MSNFWLGVAIIPGLVGVAYLIYSLYHIATIYLTRWRKPWWTVGDEQIMHRALQAAGVALARRSWHLALPFGVAIVYRTVDDPAVRRTLHDVFVRFTKALQDTREENG